MGLSNLLCECETVNFGRRRLDLLEMGRLVRKRAQLFEERVIGECAGTLAMELGLTTQPWLNPNCRFVGDRPISSLQSEIGKELLTVGGYSNSMALRNAPRL